MPPILCFLAVLPGFILAAAAFDLFAVWFIGITH